MKKLLRGWLAFALGMVLLIFAGSAAAQEGFGSLGAAASPILPSLESRVLLQVSSALLGQDARLDLVPGSGSEWTIDGAQAEQPWSFGVAEGSVSFLLKDSGGTAYLFEADHSVGDDSVIYLCRELPEKDITAVRKTDGSWSVSFPFDLSGFETAEITVSMALDTDWSTLPAGKVYRGIHPLYAAVWTVGEEYWQFPLTESGFVSVPLPVEAGVRTEGTELAAGDASFALKGEEGILAQADCDENGRADFASWTPFPAAEDGSTRLTVSQLSETGGGLKADDRVYALYIRTAPYEWTGASWETVRQTVVKRVNGQEEEEVAAVEEPLSLSFDSAELLDASGVETEPLLCEFVDEYSAVGECVIRGQVQIPTRYGVAWENEFSLVLLEGDREIARTFTKSGGSFAFPPLRYGTGDIGVHTYTVRQEAGDVGGVTYDLSGHEVSVEVRDLGHGLLEAAALGEPEIVNVYSASGSLDLPVTTVLTGRAIRDGEFEYGLFEGETLLGSAACDTTGRAVIHVDYTVDDVREGKGTGHRSSQRAYTLRLINGDSLSGGIVPDSGEIAVRVILTENGGGRVNASFVPEAESLVFNHQYRAAGRIMIVGQLSLTQGALSEGQFSFLIFEGEKQVCSAVNDEDGLIAFPAIVYNAGDVGEHTYTVRQQISAAAGIQQDETVYTVTANVFDNGDGTLRADYVVLDSQDGRIGFENGYQASGSFTPSFDIDLMGRPIGENEFSFRLFENGSLLQEAWADTEGHVVFEPIEYRVRDIGTHTYVVRAGHTPEAAVESDRSAVNIVVDVRDTGYGRLNAAARSRTETFAFVYTPYGSYQLDAYVSLKGRDLREGEMTFYIMEGTRYVASGTNDAAGRIVFEPLEYSRKDIGTHLYTVVQSEFVPGGVTRDGTNYSMTVYVTDDGNGTLVTECDRLKNLSFACAYNAEGSFAPDVRVALSDADLREEQFTFEIVEYGRIVKTQTNSRDGKVDFRPFAYTLADVGQHEYTVRQVGTGSDGIELDKNMYRLTVTVSDNGDGTLRAETGSEGIVFSNRYLTRGVLMLEAGVTLAGRALRENEFAVRILNGEETVAEGRNGADGKVVISPITFDNESLRGTEGKVLRKKTLTMTAELIPAQENGGVSLDRSVIPFRVYLTDNGDGTMEASASVSNADLAFGAVYTASGELKLSARVLLDGKAPAAGSFKAGLYEQDRLIAEAENDAEGVFGFDPIAYGLENTGRHTYVLCQTSRREGVVQDMSRATVSCLVTDDGSGALRVDCEWSEPVFSNRTANTGEMEAAAAITLDGRALQPGDFSFVMTEDGETISTGVNDADGYVMFAPVSYTQEDIGGHRYFVSIGDVPPGVETDEREYEIAVSVGLDGTGKVCWYTDDPVIPEFDAVYCAHGGITLEGRVELQGRAPEEGQFTLALYRDGVLVQEKTTDGDGRVLFDEIACSSHDAGELVYSIIQSTPDRSGYTVDRTPREVRVRVTDELNGTLTAVQNMVPLFVNAYRSAGSIIPDVRVSLDGRELREGEFRFAIEQDGKALGEAVNDPDGNVRFEALDYSTGDDGEHFVTVRALDGDGDGVSLTGEREVRMTVDVRDLGDGTMAVSCGDKADFHFEYTAAGSLQITVRTELAGRSLREGEFRYELLEQGRVLSEASADRDGLCAFEPVAYALADTGSREYVVRLAGSLPAGVSGATEVRLMVDSADDGSGNVVFTAAPELPCAFSYVYAPTGSAAFAFRVVSAIPMNGGEYLISMKDENGNTYTAVNDEDGYVRFNPIKYTLADVGEHVYTVHQETGTLGGVVYDGTVYRINVRVSEDDSGRLVCAYNADNVEFVNGYGAQGEWTCRARVILQGMDADKGRVTLSLTENGKVLSQAEMDGEGNVTFAPLRFTLEDAGVREYRIYASSETYSKLIADEEGTAAYVTVKDNGDGTLSCESGDVPEIRLSYESAGHAAVEVAVTLDGRPVQDGEFRFALYEGNDLKDTARADENGRAAFDVYYETGAAGIHTYTVRQLDPEKAGVTWEDSARTVTAAVEDLGNGEMDVRLTYPEGGAVYHNTYTASGRVQIRTSVALAGKPMRASQFSFALYRDGELLSEASNDQDGGVVFPEMEIIAKDGEIIEYSVGQLPGSESGILYDDTVYPVLVRVTDDREGVLTADYAVPPAFRNTYAAAGEAALFAQVNLVGRKLSEGSFTLTLSEDGAALQSKGNDAEGRVAFDPIVYGLADVGSHEYTIAESATSEAGVPLDPEVKTIRTNVSDLGDGTLKVTVSDNGPEFQNSFTARKSFAVRAKVTSNVPDTELDTTLYLKDAEDNLLEEISARNGVNSFTPLVFTQADAGKQFVYTVSCSGIETVYTVRASVSDGLNGVLGVASEVIGPEGSTESIQFAVEHTVSLTLSAAGAEEAVRFTVELEQDGSRLLGEYPVEGAREGVISSGGSLTLEKNRTAVISDLPYGISYRVSCGAVPRYDVTAENAEGLLDGPKSCSFALKLATVSFKATGIWYDENGNRKDKPISADLWTLYEDGRALDTGFGMNGTEYTVDGLTKGGEQGGEFLYSAVVEAPENTTVSYVNIGAYRDETERLYNGGTVILQDGASFRVRVRFSAGTDENGEAIYTYRSVTGTLYREDGETMSVTMNPDENGWCVLTDIEKDMLYYVIPSGVAGYTASYRNGREYGNVTNRVYNEGTVTFTPGNKPLGRRQILLYAGGGAAALGAAAFGAVFLARKRKEKSSETETEPWDNNGF